MGREEFHMSITILVTALRHGERCCQRGPAGQGQNNIGRDEEMHCRGRDKKNVVSREDVKSGDGRVVKIKSK
jgi:hypothetical protein